MLCVNHISRAILSFVAVPAILASALFADEGAFTTLGEFESAAFQNNPTINARLAQVEAARHQAAQAGLKTNPSFGIYGEEIGNDENSIFGAFISRTIRRGDKRFRDQEVQLSTANVLEQQLRQQKIRVETDVRTAFYNVLIVQRQLELSRQLNEAQQGAAAQTKQLYENDESAKTDLFQAEIKAQQTALRVRQNELNHVNAWRELVAVVGLPELQLRYVDGSLDHLPEEFEWNLTLETILACSPEVSAAQVAIKRAEAVYRQAVANSVPDLQTQINIGHDTSTNDTFGGFQIGMPLQINNRNQGNIAAALSSVRQAQNELRRVQLAIQQRLAVEFRLYQQAREQTDAYTNQMLPKAKETLDLANAGYREGETSFLQLLAAQQTTIDLTTQYLQALQQLWNSHQKIGGLLLSGSLDPQ